MKKISIYDTTLRDGAQGEGVSFSDTGKVHLAMVLDDFGIDIIEGGFAGSNPRDLKFFELIKKERLSHARIAAFGSTRRADTDAADDPQLAGLLAAETEICTIYGKSWVLHVEEVLRTSRENNLQMIADTVGHLRQHGREVIYDAEHFFDGYKHDAAYALATLDAALREGACELVLCDTNGGCLPHEIAGITADVIARFPSVAVGIHCHNDAGLAVANSLEAVRVGATSVQATINGLGERTGNADFTAIIPALLLKMGRTAAGVKDLAKLRDVSRKIDDFANRRSFPHQPYVGRNAFAHKAGAHANGIQKNPASFEHIDPAAVGNARHVLVSELSGGSNVAMKARELGMPLVADDKALTRNALDLLKTMEKKGYSYESADGSFKILLRKVLDQAEPFFELEGFRVSIEKMDRSGPSLSDAIVKVRVGDEVELTAAEGSGPVDALNSALRKALLRFYPNLGDVVLTDYRVRILDPKEATGAVTRVLIESADAAGNFWGTVGVSENIIEASWQALVDSLEYKLYEDADRAAKENA